MTRHQRSGYTYPSFSPVENNIQPVLNSDIIFYNYGDELPTDRTNCSLSSVQALSPNTQSLLFSNGYISLNSISLSSKNWVFDLWYYSASTTTIPLFSITNSLDIFYSKSTNTFNIKRYINSELIDTQSWITNLSINTWNHVLVQRDNNTLLIIINGVELIENTTFFDSILAGNAFIGKTSTDQYTGYLSNIRLLNNFSFNKYYILNNLNALTYKNVQRTELTDNSQQRFIDLKNTEYINNSILYPTIKNNTTTYYNYETSEWVIKPSIYKVPYTLTTGLMLESDPLINCPIVFCLDFNFKLIAPTEDVVLFSNWTTDINRYFYCYYSFSDNKIKFKYVNSTLQIITITLGNFVSNTKTEVTLQTLNPGLNIFLNGKKVYTSAVSIYPLKFSFYMFNIAIDAISTANTLLYVNKFSITRGIKKTRDYVPVENILRSKLNSRKSSLFRYHTVEDNFSTLPAYNVKFSVSGSNSVVPNSTNTYTIACSKSNFNEVYNLKIVNDSGSEIVSSDVTLSANSVTINAEGTIATFNVIVSNFAINPYKSKFNLLVTNRYTKFLLPISIVDSRSLALTYITGLSSYIDGYLIGQTTSNGTIPNLTATNNATTTAAYINSAIHGKGHLVKSSADRVVLPAQLTTVRSVICVYKEIDYVPNRSYVGTDVEYTFNGGASGELVGNKVILNDSQFTKLNTYTYKAPSITLSADNSTFVVVDDSQNKVFVYGKDVNNAWITTPIQLTLDIASANLLQDAAVSINSNGTIILLGIKNANSGEGVVQQWRKIAGTWTKDLHLGSPVPAPTTGGFGHAVAMSDNGNKLYVSEIGTNSVYYYEKGTLWSATPTDTLTNTNRFGFSISTVLDGTKIAIVKIDTNQTFIYNRLTSSFSLEQTISFGNFCSFNKVTGNLILNNYLTKQVKIYERTTSWNEIKTISSSATNFGYSVSTSNNGNIAIGSPDEKKVYVYLSDSNWTTFQTFTETYTTFGYSVNLNNFTLLASNYDTKLELFSNENLAVQNIVKVRQNEANTALPTLLDKANTQVLGFSSSTAIKVKWVGDSKINTSLNGLLQCVLFFNTVLTDTEFANIEDLLLKYFQLKKYRLLTKNN